MTTQTTVTPSVTSAVTSAVTPTVNSAQSVPAVQTDNTRLWLGLSLLAVYLIWGSTYLALRFALESFPPFMLVGIRFVTAGVLMFALLRARGAALPTLKQAANAALIGFFLLVVGMGGVTFAEQKIASGLTALLVSTLPLWMLVFTAILWKVTPTRYEWAGVALELVGVGLLGLEGNLQANPLGVAIILMSSISWSFGSTLSRRLDLPKGMMTNAVEMTAGGAMLLILSLVRGEQLTSAPTPNALFAMIYLITFGSLIVYSAYLYLLQKVRPALATSYAFVNPVIALWIGVAFGGEILTGSALIALPIILLGVGIVALRRK